MTIKINQNKNGKVKEYEFCCWDSLRKWLNRFEEMDKCEVCK